MSRPALRSRRRTRAVLSAVLAAGLGGCGDSAQYLPLQPGLSWHYEMERTTMDGTRVQKLFLRTLPGRARYASADGAGEVEAVARQSLDGSEELLARTAEGVVRLGGRHRDDSEPVLTSAPRLLLPHAPEVGMRWTTPTRTQVLEKTGPPQETLYKILVELPMTYEILSVDDTVSVPAGRFEGCIRVRGTASTHASVGNYIGSTDILIESTDWYAPGIGLVKSERRETTTSSALDAGRSVMELVEVTGG